MAEPAYAYPPRGMRRGEAARYVGLSASAWDKREDRPEPVYIGPKTPVWFREDLDAWLDRIAGRAPASEDGEGYADAW